MNIKSEKYQYHMPSNSIEGRRNGQIPLKRGKKFQNNEELMWPIHSSCRAVIQVSNMNIRNFWEKKKKERKEATFAEFEEQLLNFLCHVNGGKIETISWLNKKC